MSMDNDKALMAVRQLCHVVAEGTVQVQLDNYNRNGRMLSQAEKGLIAHNRITLHANSMRLAAALQELMERANG